MLLRSDYDATGGYTATINHTDGDALLQLQLQEASQVFRSTGQTITQYGRAPRDLQVTIWIH